MPDDRRVLEGVEWVVVDGSNVLHALQRTPGAVPAAALIGRLRAMIPPGVQITLVLDGSPEHGLVSRRLASGVDVRYSGRYTADEVIARIAENETVGGAGLLVVTDDIALAGGVRRLGARTVRNRWLLERLERQRLSSPAPGRPTSPRPPAASGHPLATPPGGAGAGADADGEAATPRWSPGRGATRKRGNPKRGH